MSVPKPPGIRPTERVLGCELLDTGLLPVRPGAPETCDWGDAPLDAMIATLAVSARDAGATRTLRRGVFGRLHMGFTVPMRNLGHPVQSGRPHAIKIGLLFRASALDR